MIAIDSASEPRRAKASQSRLSIYINVHASVVTPAAMHGRR